MNTLASVAFFTASVVIAAASTDDSAFGPLTIDLHYWGNVLVWTVGVLVAGTWLWQRTGARAVRWFQHQGKVHEQVLDELQTANKAIADHEGRIKTLEGKGS